MQRIKSATVEEVTHHTTTFFINMANIDVCMSLLVVAARAVAVLTLL